MQFGSIFLGNTGTEQRKFLKEALTFLKSKGYERVYAPCCGQFAIAGCAVDAGFEPQNVFNSDMSLFSSVIGYYYSNQPIDTIPLQIGDEQLKEIVDNPEIPEIRKASEILLAIKKTQFRTHIAYEKAFVTEMTVNKDYYLREIESKLTEAKRRLDGIRYEIRDLRDYIQLGNIFGEKDIIIVNPPAYEHGYKRMFRHDELIKVALNIDEFMFKREYKNLFDQSLDNKPLYIWLRNEANGGLNEHYHEYAVYAKEFSVERAEYWLCTRPQELDDFLLNRNVWLDLPAKKKLGKFELFGINDEIKENSIVAIHKVDKQTADYYRELWAHKLGQTNAEAYYLIFIDKKLVGTVGFHSRDLRLCISDKLFENFCFNIPSNRYPKLNRLMMMLLTCTEMRDLFLYTSLKTNRMFSIAGLKTTCLSKYRKVKLNNGLLKVTKREKMKNGMYKIVYETDWYNRTFSDCVKLFLQEQNQKDYAENP